MVPTDLHGHSGCSDGRTTPEEFVAFRARRGLSVIALSDHDVLTGVRRAAAAAAAAGLTLVPAMEATSFVGFGTSEAEQLHVLAYFPPRMLADGSLERTRLHRRGLVVQERWRAFALGWIADQAPAERALLGEDALRALLPAEFPGLLLFVDGLRARRAELVQAFVRHHVRFWTEDRELFGWSPEELIDTIRADGAVDVVAHPARYRDKERLARVLLGASGVEVYTSRHRPEWAARFLAFAEAQGKLWTSSSDDHQNAAYHHPPSGTPAWVVERILDASLPAALHEGAAARVA
jgi:predicted metal-dependent phosphoesterase TrpH